MEEKIKQLIKIIKESNNIVFLGGAGVSTESGLKDFRSQNGIYATQYKYPAETILSHNFFYNHNDEFYDFYFKEMIQNGIKPNRCHRVLAKLEKLGKLKAIITQNIDGLHQLAGSTNVLELHGSVLDNYCTGCGEYYSLDELKNLNNYRCPTCNSLIKPKVVLYNEMLDEDILYKSVDFINKAEVLIVGGTSLNVSPANFLINYFKGKHLILINLNSTPYDNYFNLVIYDKIGDVFDKIDNEVY